MKAVQVTRSGGPEVFQLVDVPATTPDPGLIVIEVKAAGSNFAGLVSREGHYAPGATAMESAGAFYSPALPVGLFWVRRCL